MRGWRDGVSGRWLREATEVVAVAVALGVVVGCGEGGAGENGTGEERPEPVAVFDTVAASVITASDTVRIKAELADTGNRREYGLMERPSLPEDHGMIFVYPEEVEGDQPFWMFRTEIPLDIAFLSADGRIVAILGMQPCRSPNPEFCRGYPPGVPYRGALEMALGWFDAHGVAVGDRVVPAPGDLPARP